MTTSAKEKAERELMPPPDFIPDLKLKPMKRPKVDASSNSAGEGTSEGSGDPLASFFSDIDQLDSETGGQTAAVPESNWKQVLHPESGRFYFWNVATGEVSWVKPDEEDKEKKAPEGDGRKRKAPQQEGSREQEKDRKKGPSPPAATRGRPSASSSSSSSDSKGGPVSSSQTRPPARILDLAPSRQRDKPKEQTNPSSRHSASSSSSSLSVDGKIGLLVSSVEELLLACRTDSMLERASWERRERGERVLETMCEDRPDRDNPEDVSVNGVAEGPLGVIDLSEDDDGVTTEEAVLGSSLGLEEGEVVEGGGGRVQNYGEERGSPNGIEEDPERAKEDFRRALDVPVDTEEDRMAAEEIFTRCEGLLSGLCVLVMQIQEFEPLAYRSVEAATQHVLASLATRRVDFSAGELRARYLTEKLNEVEDYLKGLSESPEVEAIRASLEARARSSEVQDGAARTAGSAGFGGGHAAASSSAGVRSSPSSAGGIPQRTRTTVEQGGGVISRPAVISRPPALRPGRSPPGPPPG
uniref:WW domain-containing protein n=1 Tax=Chromera velia CCMP2878 TaxID=1169474 RepID=A0A0G4GU09_9ALVE|eukprot:Cvel_23337.t1-p1 / transcript=Cvel_23337.t1 / gene=Cvel_23337 / organism=Chromera_velia_CCMP2878 / gene_product=hypothetical protein / transcript_product=hypothetical protein / location=Cvel_scaffold2392:414-4620(-) / protein_length=525 / sequence_SO=supercontig / SO=protein_coding / is_pseudo=false